MQPTITPEYLASQGLSPTFPERFWKRVNKNGPIPKHNPSLGNCWVWTSPPLNKKGYGSIWPGLSKNHHVRAHVARWILHFGPVPHGMCVCHHCDNTACVRGKHLWLGTIADNLEDMTKKLRRANGERHGMHILTSSDVIIIRELYRQGGVSMTDIANHFGVTLGAVWPIIRRKAWRHI